MQEHICTICLEEISENAPNVCNCKNTVHIVCLLEWINHKNTTICEICNSQYKIDENILNEYLSDLYIENNQCREDINEDIENIENIQHIEDNPDMDDNSDIDDNYEQYRRHRRSKICSSYVIIVCILLPCMACFISFIIYLLYNLYNNNKSQSKNN